MFKGAVFPRMGERRGQTYTFDKADRHWSKIRVCPQGWIQAGGLVKKTVEKVFCQLCRSDP